MVLLFTSAVVLGAIAWWISNAPTPVPAKPDPSTRGTAAGSEPAVLSRTRLPRTPPSVAPAAAAYVGELVPDEVVDNPDCMMAAGRGRAKDIALIVVPGAIGARFAVLDGDGTVFADWLPFRPHRLHLGRRADGAVTAGLGDIRLNSLHYRDPDAPEPVRIYSDGHLVYQTDKARDFAVAPDGSSFFVVEPTAGSASRLLVRNLDLRTELHFDLDTDYTPDNAYDPSYLARYTGAGQEVVLFGGGDNGRGLHRFFSVTDGKVRAIRIGPGTNAIVSAAPVDIEIEDDVFMTHLVSSEDGYFSYAPHVPAETTGMLEDWRIVRRRFAYGAEPTTEDTWSREIPLAGFGGTVIDSGDGRWLALNAWNFQLLDASTGETVFEFPHVDKKAEMTRLSNVMPSDATVADVGSVTGISFRNDQLLFYRQIGSTESCELNARNGLDSLNACVADLRRRGLYRTLVDVFDLDSITVNSAPDFRVDFDPFNQCATGDFPLRGLQVRDNRLTFMPPPR